ncbi:hypothetical protein IP91_00135 [Pseudoduganella lurida]|uniref:Uncharacterized protein n=2 Tax=Pseudoduganella lurida TaxID=1036180 RepID=A0A562RKX1_9BURK|nr:hypothetical protein IP91_00135 [Pseudoduganella lurida]
MGPPVQSERRKGLPVTVVMLRRDGQRLTSGEFHAAPRLRGEFILRPTSRHQTGGGASHMAELIVAGALHFTPLGLPLFNPTIELADHRGFVVSGYEIHSAGGKLAHVEQAWLVTPHGGV